jgi:hypothetical protein
MTIPERSAEWLPLCGEYAEVAHPGAISQGDAVWIQQSGLLRGGPHIRR